MDRIDKYNIHHLKLQIKKLLGLYASDFNEKASIRELLVSVYQYLNFYNRKNPYWDFNFLRKIEREHNISSVFFFLNKHERYVDSYYSFDDVRIKKLIKFLESEKCEIGLHGAVKSAHDQSILQKHYNLLNSITESPISGIRQHRLNYELPLTAKIHEMTGLSYDASLGFAASTGFRNSYCHPFRLFDFEEQKPVNVWQFPLNTMDASLFDYMQLSIEEAFDDTKAIVEAIGKHNGIFTLLWHNGYFDEQKFPGITGFYKNIIQHISSLNAETTSGVELAHRLDDLDKTEHISEDEIKIY